MTDDKYKNYLRDLGCLTREYAIEAKNRSKGTDYDEGYLMGYHRFLTLMMQQAEAFNIPLEELCLKDFDPYNDLL